MAIPTNDMSLAKTIHDMRCLCSPRLRNTGNGGYCAAAPDRAITGSDLGVTDDEFKSLE